MEVGKREKQERRTDRRPITLNASNCGTRPLQVTSTINWIERKHPSTNVERRESTARKKWKEREEKRKDTQFIPSISLVVQKS